MNNLKEGADRGHTQALVLLDLSAAFDTVDHATLADRMAAAGLRGTALKWMKSFLKDRTQLVRLAPYNCHSFVGYLRDPPCPPTFLVSTSAP